MRRVLVPVDGSDLSQSIISDARRLAGPHGELILIRDASNPGYDLLDGVNADSDVFEQVEEYLDRLACELRRDGLHVCTQTFVMGTPERAIQEAIKLFKPDMVACATHARHGIDRLSRGSVAWAVLTHSTVPVLLRHPKHPSPDIETDNWYRRRILVPLDGSELAESALPLARQLAADWNASICLVRVVPERLLAPSLGPGVPVQVRDDDQRAKMREANEYLDSVASSLQGEVHKAAVLGTPVTTLTALVDDWVISDVVMASHGRSGLAQVLLGSVADALLQSLEIPIIVVSALAATKAVYPPAIRRDEEIAVGP